MILQELLEKMRPEDIQIVARIWKNEAFGNTNIQAIAPTDTTPEQFIQKLFCITPNTPSQDFLLVTKDANEKSCGIRIAEYNQQQLFIKLREGFATPTFSKDRFCGCRLDKIQTGLQDHAGTGERPARNG